MTPIIKYFPKNASQYDKWCIAQDTESLRWSGYLVKVIEVETL